MSSGLDFDTLRAANLMRLPAFGHALDEWSPCDWMTALAGEVGEAANLIKKMRRNEVVPLGDLARELADAQIYLDLLAARLRIDLGTWTVLKFNEVSRRKQIGVRLVLAICPRCMHAFADHRADAGFNVCDDGFLPTAPEPYPARDATDDGCSHTPQPGLESESESPSS